MKLLNPGYPPRPRRVGAAAGCTRRTSRNRKGRLRRLAAQPTSQAWKLVMGNQTNKHLWLDLMIFYVHLCTFMYIYEIPNKHTLAWKLFMYILDFIPSLFWWYGFNTYRLIDVTNSWWWLIVLELNNYFFLFTSFWWVDVTWVNTRSFLNMGNQTTQHFVDSIHVCLNKE